MLGRVRPSWCPACKTPPGPDCPDIARSPRQVRRAEDIEVRAYVSRLWAEDWSCPEDWVYD